MDHQAFQAVKATRIPYPFLGTTKSNRKNVVKNAILHPEVTLLTIASYAYGFFTFWFLRYTLFVLLLLFPLKHLIAENIYTWNFEPNPTANPDTLPKAMNTSLLVPL